jgi:metallo-beta-lactamase class B
MKILLIAFILLFLQSSVFPQGTFKTINVSRDIELVKLSDNAYVHVSYSESPKIPRYSSNGLIFINGGEAFLFDTPVTDALTKKLVSWIKDSLKAKLVGFMPNHWHADCMGGLRYLKRIGIESYANQMTIKIAKSKKLSVPAHGFKDSLQIPLGDKTIECYYLGPAHSLDNIVVWIPSERILFAGCMVKSLDSKNLGNIADGDLAAYPKTIDKVIKKFLDVKIVIPGHGNIGAVDLLLHTEALLAKVATPN